MDVDASRMGITKVHPQCQYTPIANSTATQGFYFLFWLQSDGWIVRFESGSPGPCALGSVWFILQVE
jgi:hypothetical protein